MAYTDARGRPELVADPGLKNAAAVTRLVAGGGEADNAPRPAAVAEGSPAGVQVPQGADGAAPPRAPAVS